MSRKRRPSVSMTPAVFRLMAHAADTAELSRCAFVEAAIMEKIEREGASAPQPDWTPEHRQGRPPIDRAEAEARANFTF